MKEKIFVTGATGLIGMHLTQRLLEEGYEVAGLTTSSHGATKLTEHRVKPYIGNILNADEVMKAIGDYKPDIIIHQITDLKNANMEDNAKVRIEGTTNLVEAALKYSVKKIISQSIYFAVEGGEGLADETSPLDLKSTGERLTTVKGVQVLEEQTARLPQYVILRFGYLYGPGTWFGKDGMIYQQFINGEVSVTDGEISFIHIEDAVDSTIQSLSFKSGIYHVVDDEPLQYETWAKRYAEHLNVTPQIHITEHKNYERGSTNSKFKAAGGRLKYPTFNYKI